MAPRSASRRPAHRVQSCDSRTLAAEESTVNEIDFHRFSAFITHFALKPGQKAVVLFFLCIFSLITICYELCRDMQRRENVTVLPAIVATAAFCGSAAWLFFELRRFPGNTLWLRARSDWLLNNPDGIALTDSTVLFRRSKCAEIYTKLESQPVRIIRSPPGSGKSSLATLLLHNRSMWRASYLIDLSGWHEQTTSFEDYWRESTGASIESSLNPTSGWPRTYIIDEAQTTFSLGPTHLFWKCIKHINAHFRESRAQVLLLGVYCAPAPPGDVAANFPNTPVNIPDGWSLSYLSFDALESDEFFATLRETFAEHNCPPIPATLQATILRVCGNHVGLLRIAASAHARLYTGHGSKLSSHEESEFIRQDLLVLGNNASFRALPVLGRLSANKSSWLQRAALAGPAGLPINLIHDADDDLIRLLQIGVFDLDSQPRLHFTSHIMQTHALRQMFSPLRSVPIATLGVKAIDVARAIVKRLDPRTLSESLSVSAAGTLLERQYQISFFACVITGTSLK